MAKVLIQDIAREMNLSRNTISKALKNDESVSESTRARIIQVASAMGYDKITPEMEAFAHGQKKEASNGRYAILMTDFADDDFWQGVVRGITEELRKANGICFLVLASIEDVGRNVLPSALLSERVDGIICMTMFPEKYYHKLETLDIPIVHFDKPRYVAWTGDALIPQGADSVYALTMDLIRKGRQQIGFIGDITYCESIRDRYAGYLRAMTDSHRTPDACFCWTEDAQHFYSIDSLHQRLNALDTLPDAFVCANDWIALRVMQYCKRHAIAMPEQMAITGFDNKKECLIIEPNLSSVNTTNRRLGRRIAQQLLWRIDNPDMHAETVWIATEPYIRESSGT